MIFPRRQITSQSRRLPSPCLNDSSKRSGTWDGMAVIIFAPLFETVYDLTFLVVMTRLDDPCRQVTGASNFAFKIL
jgi:hypothetical protein